MNLQVVPVFQKRGEYPHYIRVAQNLPHVSLVFRIRKQAMQNPQAALLNPLKCIPGESMTL